MVSIISVSLLKSNLKENVQDLGGEITAEERTRSGDYRYEEIEAYWDVEDHDVELETELLDLVDGTEWRLGFTWDSENGGVLFERDLEVDGCL